MVGIVLVSHSAELAAGAVALAREMGGAEVTIEAAGGLAEPGALGTDAERIRTAVQRAMSGDGVLVLMDLGSAVMSAELAVEMLDAGAGRVRLSAAPLVEGAVAAAAAAAGGAGLAEVAARAEQALAMKAGQLAPASPANTGSRSSVVPPADAEGELSIVNEIGLHARPAVRLTRLVRRFDAAVLISRGRDGPWAQATGLTDVIALGARRGDTLAVRATGPQAAEALQALQALARDGFGDGAAGDPADRVDTTPRSDPPDRMGPPDAHPRGRPTPGTVLRGAGASPGIATGAARQLGATTTTILRPPPARPGQAPDRERDRLRAGIARARAELRDDRQGLAARVGNRGAEILDVQTALLDDPALQDRAAEAIAGGASAERAWHDATEAVAALYRELDGPLLRERATDVLDAGRRVLTALGADPPRAIRGSGIIIAAELTPGEAARLDPQLVTGVATAHGAATAHAAILARSLGIPAVVGLGEAVLGIADGTMLLLDGDAGTLVAAPAPAAMESARRRAGRAAAGRAAAAAHASEPAVTRDGTRIEVAANLAAEDDAARAVAAGADGVGLLRTELLYLQRASLPDEDEQAEALRRIARALDGRSLVVRTLDAGADKPLPALPMPAEANPSLGVRGIRLSLAAGEVLVTQLRAILRVAAEFPVRVMLPMVATVAEVIEARRLLQQARADTGVRAELPLGVMVEVPAAALTAPRLAEHVDFFSVGTNDLTQYTMAAERGDERLAPLLEGCQPAVLRLVAQTVRAAAARDRWVGVCGELASDPAAAVLLVGLGVTELSLAPAMIPAVKATVRSISLADARAAAGAALDADDAAGARALGAALLKLKGRR